MIEIIAAVVGTAGGGFALYQLQKWTDNRISIKRITSSTDKYVQGLTSLYDYHFSEDDGTNYTIEEIVEMMNAKFDERRIVEVENITLVAVLKKEVVGFIFCHLYPKARKAIVSYFAVKEGVDYHEHAAHKLLAKLKTILIEGHNCDQLFFEIQGFDERTPKPEQRKRRSLRLLFSKEAQTFGLSVREFDFPYQCPKISMAEDTHESPFSLFSVGLRKPIPAKIPKHQMLEFLEFIYLECYGDLYPLNDKMFYKHHEHLQQLVEHYEKTLPDIIDTIDGKHRWHGGSRNKAGRSLGVAGKQLPVGSIKLLD